MDKKRCDELFVLFSKWLRKQDVEKVEKELENDYRKLLARFAHDNKITGKEIVVWFEVINAKITAEIFKRMMENPNF